MAEEPEVRDKATVMAELAAAEATTTQDLAWELGRREMEATKGLSDPVEVEEALLAVRVAWIEERELQHQVEAALQRRIDAAKARQAQGVGVKAKQFYGAGPTVGTMGMFPSQPRPPVAQREPTVLERVRAGEDPDVATQAALGEHVREQLRAG